MVSNREDPKRSLARRIFICATWAALAYSVYSITDMFGPQRWLPVVNNSRDITSPHSRDITPPQPADKPSEAELSGMWVPDEETATRLRGLNVKFADGSAITRLSLDKSLFEANDLPYMAKESGPQVLFASWRGNWNLYRQQDMWAVYLPGGPVDVRGFLHKEGPRYRLQLVVGDPSLTEPLWLVKK